MTAVGRRCTWLWGTLRLYVEVSGCNAQAVKPRDFASQINLSMENCWGIVRALIDVCMALDDGKYLLVK